MEQLLTRLAANRETPGAVCTRLQSSLHILTDSQILVLHAVPNGNTLRVVLPARLAHVAEVKVKDDSATVDVQRELRVRVHAAFIAIDHEVRVLPEIPRAIALRVAPVAAPSSKSPLGSIAGNSGLRFRSCIAVVKNAAEGLVQVRDVVAAVEIVIYENLPVAGDVVNLAIEEVEFAESRGSQRFTKPPRKSVSGSACGSRFTKTNASQVSAFTGTNPLSWRSKFLTPSNSGIPLSAPSRP